MSDNGLTGASGSASFGTLTDEAGNVLISAGIASDGSGAVGPALQQIIQAGFPNGNFAQPPHSPDASLSDHNVLPFWSMTIVSGTSIAITSVADSLSASGRSIQFVMSAGAAGDDVYIEQIVPVAGTRTQAYHYHPVASFLTGASVSAAQLYLSGAFLKADGVTTTGSGSTTTKSTTSIGASTLYEGLIYGSTTGAVPADAAYFRFRVGFQRSGAATSTVETLTLTEVRLIVGPSELALVDSFSPSTYGWSQLTQVDGELRIATNVNVPTGFTPSLRLTGSDGSIKVRPANGAGVSLETASGQSPYLDFTERTAPAAPAANQARLYCVDNGAGKTQLVVVFNTGAVQVLATQP